MLSAASFQFAPWNIRRAFSLDPTDCPWVSEYAEEAKHKERIKWASSRQDIRGWLAVQFPNPARHSLTWVALLKTEFREDEYEIRISSNITIISEKP